MTIDVARVIMQIAGKALEENNNQVFNALFTAASLILDELQEETRQELIKIKARRSD